MKYSALSIPFTALALAVLMISSCTAPTHGLFYTVEKEVSIVQSDSGLPKTFNPTRIDSFNGVYVVTGSVLYATTPAGTWPGENNHIGMNTWSQVAMPAADVSTYSTAVCNGVFYALTIGNNSSAGVAIYKTTFDSSNYTSLSTANWTQVQSGIDVATNRPERLFSVNNELILQTQTTQTNGWEYQLFLFDQSAQTWSELSSYNTPVSDSDNSAPWVGIEYLDSSTSFWFLRRNGELYTAPDLNTVPSAKTIANLPDVGDPMFRASFADASVMGGSKDTLYLMSQKGFVTMTNDSGATWVCSSIKLKSDTSSYYVGFCTATHVWMTDINDQSSPKGYVLFGSTGDDSRYYGDGVYYLSDSSTMELTELELDNGNYTSTELQNNGVNYLFFDTTAGTSAERLVKPVFACSSTNGLWSALMNSNEKTDPALIWAWE